MWITGTDASSLSDFQQPEINNFGSRQYENIETKEPVGPRTRQSAHADPCPPPDALAEQWQKVACSAELEFFRSGRAARSTGKHYGDRPVRRSECSALGADLPSMRMLLWHAPTVESLLLTLHPCKWKLPLSAGYHHPVLRCFWGDVALIFHWFFKSEPWRSPPQMCWTRHDSEPSEGLVESTSWQARAKMGTGTICIVH